MWLESALSILDLLLLLEAWLLIAKLINDSCLFNLLSNASDALDKLRFLSVTDPGLLKEAIDFDIRIQTDKDNGILSIT